MRKKYEGLLERSKFEEVPKEDLVTKELEDPYQKERKRRNKAANIFVSISLAMCIIITLVVLYDYHRLDLVLGSGEITALMALWGGELLIIALRQIFGSDVIKKRKEEDEDQ